MKYYVLLHCVFDGSSAELILSLTRRNTKSLLYLTVSKRASSHGRTGWAATTYKWRPSNNGRRPPISNLFAWQQVLDPVLWTLGRERDEEWSNLGPSDSSDSTLPSKDLVLFAAGAVPQRPVACRMRWLQTVVGRFMWHGVLGGHLHIAAACLVHKLAQWNKQGRTMS